jgi:hypothetical protein
MRSAPAIAFDYRPSRAVAAAASLVALAAPVAVCMSDVPDAAKIGACSAAVIGALLAMRCFLKPPFRRVASRALAWTLGDDSGVEHSAELVASRRLGAWVALDFRLAGRKRFRALIGPDNLDAESRRRLILVLARGELAQTG